MNILLVSSWADGPNRILKSEVGLESLNVGDVIRVGLIQGRWGQMKIKAVDSTSYWVEGSLNTPPPLPAPLSVCVGYVRPKMMRRILTTLIEIGVKDIHVFKSFLCEKSYADSDLFEPAQLEALALKALQQTCDTLLPKISVHPHLKPFLEDHLLLKFRPDEILITDPEGMSVEGAGLSSTKVVVFGPERGFSKRELEMFQKMQLSIVSFGNRHLRCETAVPFVLGQLTFFLK